MVLDKLVFHDVKTKIFQKEHWLFVKIKRNLSGEIVLFLIFLTSWLKPLRSKILGPSFPVLI